MTSGVRQTLPVHTLDAIKLAEIQQGEYFIVGGQVAYVAEVGEDEILFPGLPTEVRLELCQDLHAHQAENASTVAGQDFLRPLGVHTHPNQISHGDLPLSLRR